MAIVITGKLAETLRREAESRGLTPEEYLLELLTAGEDPAQRGAEYLEAAASLVEQARRELESGDLRQASEKIWGDCALAVEAHAYAKRGMGLESHRNSGFIKTMGPRSWASGSGRRF